MNTEIYNSLISGFIGIIATVISKFIEFPNKEKRKIRKALVGRWNVKWYEYDGLNTNKESLIVEDYLIIKNIFKDRFRTKVENTPIKYIVSGKIDLNNLIFEFQGIEGFGINGTGVLSISLNRKKMKGHWLQIDNNENNIIGRCVWTKMN